MSNANADLAEIRQLLRDREHEVSEERKSVRVALIALTGVIIAALIAAVATVVASGVLG